MTIILPAIVLGGTGFILGLLIYFVGKYFYVEEDNRIEEVVELLPKYNCGACGYAGCKEMAIALLEKSCKVAQCKPIKKEEMVVLERYLDEVFKNQTT